MLCILTMFRVTGGVFGLYDQRFDGIVQQHPLTNKITTSHSDT